MVESIANINREKSEAPNPNFDEESKSSASDEVPRTGVKDTLKLVMQFANLIVIFVPWIIWDKVSHFFTKPKSIRNKIVLLTGSGRDLGRSLALKFAELGCKLACVDMDETSNADTVRLIKQKYPSVKVIAYKCNFALVDDIKQLTENVRDDIGKVDILVNNADIMSEVPVVGSIFDTTYLDVMLDVNLRSHFLMIGAFLPNMLKRNSGHIVAISSITEFVGGKYGFLYSATKHGIVGMMESLYDELRTVPHNYIQTTCVCPYIINTNEVYSKSFDSRIPALSVKQATDGIIDAILRNKRIVTIPSYMYYYLMLLRCVPDNLRNFMINIFYPRIINGIRRKSATAHTPGPQKRE